MHKIQLPPIEWQIQYFGAFGEDRECLVKAPTRKAAAEAFVAAYFEADHIIKIEPVAARPTSR